MEKTIAYSAFLISFSIIIIGSMIIINNLDTVTFFYDFASVLFLISILGFVIIGISLVNHVFISSK